MVTKKRTIPLALGLSLAVALGGCTKSSDQNGDGAGSGDGQANAAPANLDTQPTAPTPIEVRQIDDPRESVQPATLNSAANRTVSSAAWVVVEPTRLDMGQIPTEDSKTTTVTLTNNGDEPRKVIDCKGSCSCTSIDCPRGRVLEPGETVDVTVKMDGGARPAKLTKTMRFIVEGQEPIIIPIQAEAVSYVTMDPPMLDAQQHPDGKFVLRAVDDKPFKVTGLHPPIIDELPQEAAVEHELTLNWEKWRDSGGRGKLILYLDHPNCMRVYGSAQDPAYVRGPGGKPIDPNASETQEGAAAPNRPMAQVAIERQMSGLIRGGRTQPIINAVEEGEIDVDLRETKGNTILAVASKQGDTELMQFLIDHGADIEAIGQLDRTPIMFAAESKNAEAVLMLIDSGADVNAADQLGGTPLSWAAGIGNAASVQLLLEAGAEVNVAGAITGFTPLTWAAGFGEAESVRLLIDAGADLNAPDALESATPLMHAVRTGHVQNATLLIEAGADLEARDKVGRTPLLAAAAFSGANVDTVRMLLDAGADTTAQENRGLTLWDLANKRSDPRAGAVVQLLVERGLQPEESDG